MIGEVIGGVIEGFFSALFDRWPWQTTAVFVTIALFIVLIIFLP